MFYLQMYCRNTSINITFWWRLCIISPYFTETTHSLPSAVRASDFSNLGTLFKISIKVLFNFIDSGPQPSHGMWAVKWRCLCIWSRWCDGILNLLPPPGALGKQAWPWQSLPRCWYAQDAWDAEGGWQAGGALLDSWEALKMQCW